MHCAKFESNTNRMTFEYAPNMMIVKVHPLSRIQRFVIIVLSKGTRRLPRRFTYLTYSREENRCGFFNTRNSIFWVFYKKFDWIILKNWSLLLFSKGVRETNERLNERSVNRRGRRRVPFKTTPWCKYKVYYAMYNYIILDSGS